jgi:putative effector of murein hydrolase
MTAAESSSEARDSHRSDVEVSVSIRTVLLVAGAVAVAYALVWISNVLLVVLVSVFGVAVLSPVATAVEQRLGWSRVLSATVLVLVTLLAIAGNADALRGRFYRVLTDLQNGVAGGAVQNGHHVGCSHELDKLFSLRAGTLRELGIAVSCTHCSRGWRR